MKLRTILAWACLVFVVGFLARLVIAEMHPSWMKASSYETWNTAVAFARGGCLCDPYGVPTGPSAHASPLYPLILGTLLRWIGTGQAGVQAHFFLNITLASLMWAGLPLFAAATGLAIRIGILGGFLGALLPMHLWTETHRGEPALTGVLLMAATGYTIFIWRTHSFRVGTGAMQGALWGLAFLSSASTVPAFVFLIIASFLFLRFAVLRTNLVALASAFIITSPWLIRNAVVLGSPVLRSNFGLELRVSNNELARADSDDNLAGGAYRLYHPSVNQGEAVRVRDAGEIAYNRRVLGEARTWIFRNQEAFLKLTLQRICYFWFPSVKHRLELIVVFAWTLAALAGLYVLSRQNLQLTVAIICMWAGYSIVYGLLQSSVRYSYPIRWSLTLLVAVLISAIVQPRSGTAETGC